jgi:carbon monoxide dehydrogenase subunit G
MLGGRIWRYELEPAEGGTLVRESWDISEDHQRFFLGHRTVADATRANINRTLERIDALVAPAT